MAGMKTRSRPSAGPGSRTSSRRLLLLATAASLALAFVPGAAVVTYPIRLFTTLVHEAGHALATIASGGSVVRLVLMPGGSGVTESLGGWPSLLYMSGYLGTALFGAAFLHLSRGSRGGAHALAVMGIATLAITLLWVRPWHSPFGFVAGMGIGVLILLAARLMDEAAARFTASFLAVQVSLNALYDVRDLLWMTTRTAAGNDAVFMARMYGLTPWFWAGLWGLFAVAILAASLKAYWRGSR